MIEILRMILGPVETNAYLIADVHSKEAVVIDPAWDGSRIVNEAKKRGWSIRQIWLTHAHFDHIGGVSEILTEINPAPLVALHQGDIPLWEMQGGAPLFGLRFEPGPKPNLLLQHGQTLKLGSYEAEVRHAPGHTPGHVVYYLAEAKLCFCGDVIFQGSIGRTDLPGGDYDLLIKSIQEQVLSLPDDTRLLSGHGEETLVGIERVENPFL